jgi:hypothetical protein
MLYYCLFVYLSAWYTMPTASHRASEKWVTNWRMMPDSVLCSWLYHIQPLLPPATILTRPKIVGCNAYTAELDLIDRQLPQNHIRSP